MRRAACGNFIGAASVLKNCLVNVTDEFIDKCEASCIQTKYDENGNVTNDGVDISTVFSYICE